MYKRVNHKYTAVALIVISLLAVFYPDIDTTSRVLTATDGEGGEGKVNHENDGQRNLQSPITPPPYFNFVPYQASPITPRPIDKLPPPNYFTLPPFVFSQPTPGPTMEPMKPSEPSHPPYPPGIPELNKPHNIVTVPPYFNIVPYQAPITPKPVVYWPPPSYFTLYPIYVNNQPNVLASKTTQPTTTTTTPQNPAPTIAPILPSSLSNVIPFNNGGVNGDPLIMGLSGQVFKFDGRSGAWYSGVSTNNFQWNFMTQYYEKCPKDSNNFISGVGVTIGTRKLQVIVANPYNVDVGCASDTNKHCLGGGSLELIIDGVKHVVGGDYTFKDGTGRIIAFNTYHQCK
jgi:hypothetical protein